MGRSRLRLSLVAALVAVGLASFGPVPAASAANGPPTGKLVANLVSPSTHYFADVTDPDGDPLVFEWFRNISCGSWHTTPDPDRTRWDHPNGTAEGFCPHDTPSHPGKVGVSVTDGTYELWCEREGSLPGESPCELLPPALSLVGTEGSEGETIEVMASLDRPAEGIVSFSVKSGVGLTPSACPEDRGAFSDYELPTKDFQIPAGQVSVPVPVPLIDDAAQESAFKNEFGALVLAAVSGARAGNLFAVFTILEDDTPDGVEWKQAKYSVIEGAKIRLSVLIRRLGLPKSGKASVGYRAVGGTANGGRDYEPLAGSVKWHPDVCLQGHKAPQRTKPLVTKDDKKKEKTTERLFVELHGPRGVIISPPARLVVVIVDND